MNYRKALITFFTFLGGIYFFLEFVLPEKLPEALGGYVFGMFHSEISNGFIAIGAVAFALGLINLFYVHGSKIIFKRKGALNSIALLVSLLLMAYLTLNEWISSEQVNTRSADLRNLAAFSERIKGDAEKSDYEGLSVTERVVFLNDALKIELSNVQAVLDNRESAMPNFLYEDLTTNLAVVTDKAEKINKVINNGSVFTDFTILTDLSTALNILAPSFYKINETSYRTSTEKLTYDFVYEGFFVPLGSAMFSLLGFYIISAGYRAFRIRSTESALMMIAAVIVMLGQIPFYIYIWNGLPEVRLWLLEYPSAAAFRAVKFGAAIAGLYMAVRMWFSIESSSFIEEGKEGPQ